MSIFCLVKESNKSPSVSGPRFTIFSFLLRMMFGEVLENLSCRYMSVFNNFYVKACLYLEQSFKRKQLKSIV